MSRSNLEFIKDSRELSEIIVKNLPQNHSFADVSKTISELSYTAKGAALIGGIVADITEDLQNEAGEEGIVYVAGLKMYVPQIVATVAMSASRDCHLDALLIDMQMGDPEPHIVNTGKLKKGAKAVVLCPAMSKGYTTSQVINTLVINDVEVVGVIGLYVDHVGRTDLTTTERIKHFIPVFTEETLFSFAGMNLNFPD